jgi:hypothetical protein
MVPKLIPKTNNSFIVHFSQLSTPTNQIKIKMGAKIGDKI